MEALEVDTAASENDKQRVDISTIVSFGLAIILHSLIDGLAIGVFERLEDLAVLTVSVIIHKIPVACTVGTTFLSNGQNLSQWSTRIIFAGFILASPLGMLIGMIIDTSEPNMALVVIQAMSGGVFVYLACCDLLIH